jgi:hypothetical protein
MNDYTETCVGTPNCSSCVTFACNCGNPITFLCQFCAIPHLLEPRPHLFLPLDQARKLIRKSSSFPNYEDTYVKYIKIKREILLYLDKLNQFKSKLISLKQTLVLEIESYIDSKLDDLDFFIQATQSKLADFKNRTSDLTSIESTVLDRYSQYGIKGILGNLVDNLIFRNDAVEQALEDLVTIETCSVSHAEVKIQDILDDELYIEDLISTREYNSSDMGSLLFTKNSTQDLYRYNLISTTLTTYDLSFYIDKPFNFTSSCLLPCGSVIISGGKPTHGSTYKIEISGDITCIKLGDLNTPRYAANMIFHEDTVYILGGWIDSQLTNKVEKMILGDKAWYPIPNMKEARGDFGVFVDGNRIYIIGGRMSRSVEYYDIRMNRFSMMSVEVPIGGIVCGVVDSEIYVIGNDILQIFSMDFQLLESRCNLGNATPCCCSNVVVKNSKISWVNMLYGRIYCCDAVSSKISIIDEV